jgi:hypothetical protein
MTRADEFAKVERFASVSSGLHAVVAAKDFDAAVIALSLAEERAEKLEAALNQMVRAATLGAGQGMTTILRAEYIEAARQLLGKTGGA